MDSDRIKGKAEELKGKIKEKVGELSGDRTTEAEGAAEQLKGRARDILGKVKDAGRETAEKIRGKEEPKLIDRDDDDIDQDTEEVA